MSTILIAYERESEADVLEELFAGRGHKVLRSGNGIEALEAARREPPQLMVSDILLPKMDGFALCRKWKQDERLQPIPFVFFTTRYDDPKYERFAEELGADRFLARPSEPDALINAVEELLAPVRAEKATPGTTRLPVLNEANLRLAAQVGELQSQVRRLSESEASFRRLFDANPCPAWLLDPETSRCVMVNDAALELFGYQRNEFLALGANPAEAGDEGLPSLPAPLLWHRRKDGAPLALLADKRDIEFNRRTARLIAACDVTERVDAERRAETRAGLLESLWSSVPDGYCVLDAEGRVLDANPAYCTLLGYARREIIGLTLAELQVEAEGSMATTTLRLPIGTGSERRYEARQRCKDGHVVDVEVSFSDLPAADGAEPHPVHPMPARRVMFVRDIAARRAAVRSRDDADRYRTALLELQAAARDLDEPGLLRVALEQVCRLSGSTGCSFHAVRDGVRGPAIAKHPALWSGPSVAAKAMPTSAETPDHPALVLCLEPGAGNDASTDAIGDWAAGVGRMLAQQRRYARTLQGMQRADVAVEALLGALSAAVELHDPHTAGSATRVASLAVALGRELGLDGHRQHVLRTAALLHDIGNLAIPASLLAKPTPLSDAERALLRTHSEAGHSLLASIDFQAPVAEIVLQVHERHDGSGYPRALKGEDILLEARVLMVADVVEAFCSRRAWRDALGLEKALEELEANAGRRYDPQVVGACLRLFRERAFTLSGQPLA